MHFYRMKRLILHKVMCVEKFCEIVFLRGHHSLEKGETFFWLVNISWNQLMKLKEAEKEEKFREIAFHLQK